MKGRKKWWKDTWQYQRLLEILDDYWLSEQTEAMVVVQMAFVREDGATQEKIIRWRNRNSMLKLPTLEGQFKIIPEKFKHNGMYVVPASEDIDKWETWDSLAKIERKEAEHE